MPHWITRYQGWTAFDGSTTVDIKNPASQYRITQLHLVGRYEGANDAWSAGGARNTIMFKSQSGLNSAITKRWTIQSFPIGTNNNLGFMEGSMIPRKLCVGGAMETSASGRSVLDISFMLVLGIVHFHTTDRIARGVRIC